ncbi:VIT1/CCC1 transporter family protein [Pseudothermotoga thermarum]|uniref:Rubrerythrin diiron-binding domain-containing protein n=1 Tax=Pseudothermotoga thermarum DSM 5069 TaxID=688269 RepID=F7YWH6_9THEM|nr:VIT1/CCC1 transporter family protein [Pseudothermotoga thermarum]AEH51955.1 protein of unknown function DUF125 transmembrane [Pseudothermotoga thermarum DSM 5069]
MKEFQQNEITEYLVYSKLSKISRQNREILEKIARDELRHYEALKKITGVDAKPKKLAVLWYILLAKIFGLTFALKVMERKEEKAQKNYLNCNSNELVKLFVQDEEKHEKMLLDLINEEKLNYIGSMVLGLSDALVELTGALAGLTLALQKTKVVALSGLITGFAAALSMAASDYLSKKSEKGEKNPIKSAFYTGTAYILTVLFLTFPYLVFELPLVALSVTMLNAVFVIFIFTYFVSIVKDLNFKIHFFEMLSISIGVAAVSFSIGFLIRIFLKIDI